MAALYIAGPIDAPKEVVVPSLSVLQDNQGCILTRFIESWLIQSLKVSNGSVRSNIVPKGLIIRAVIQGGRNNEGKNTILRQMLRQTLIEEEDVDVWSSRHGLRILLSIRLENKVGRIADNEVRGSLPIQEVRADQLGSRNFDRCKEIRILLDADQCCLRIEPPRIQ